MLLSQRQVLNSVKIVSNEPNKELWWIFNKRNLWFDKTNREINSKLLFELYMFFVCNNFNAAIF